MTAVASNHFEGPRGMDDQFSEPNSASRFTAVNGPPSSSPKPANGNMSNGHGQNGNMSNGHADGEDSQPDSATIVVAVADSKPPPKPAQSTPPQSFQPLLAARPPGHVEEPRSPPRRSPPRQRSPPRKRSYPEAFGDASRGPYHVAPIQEPPNAEMHREQERPAEYGRGPPESPRGPPPNLEQRRPLSREYDPHSKSLSADYSQSQHSSPYYYNGPPRPIDDADARLVEALRNENGNVGPPRDMYGSPGDEVQRRQQNGEYTSTTYRASAVSGEVDRKRRKRQFSNRTKTGCLTCRKRKKKCDEGHPECQNCLRGDFVCEGYTVRNNWPKPPPQRIPIPLKSKSDDTLGGPQQSPQHQMDVNPNYGHEATMRDLRPSPSQRPISLDDRSRERTMPSPTGEYRTPPSWSKPPRPQSGQYPPPGGYENPHEMPEYSDGYGGYASHGSSQRHGGTYPPPPSNPPSSHHAPAVAQAALSTPVLSDRPPQRRVEFREGERRSTGDRDELRRSDPRDNGTPQTHNGVPQRPLTERENMLRGEYYLPYTPALMEDRERCAAAVWRFNNSTNPMNGNSPEERLRFFKAILSLKPSQEPGLRIAEGQDPDASYAVSGSCGTGLAVEAPFHCDYGYNITIGNNVVIGPDCRISDSCSVTIGNNVVFSPGVKLVGQTYPIDPRERRKGKGRALGRSIVIENDVWIGSNVTILPGVRIGRCSVVAAGSVISKEVPPYLVMAGNPPVVIRAVVEEEYENNRERQ